MTRNNNISVLAFHRTLDEQSHRRTYAYGDIYPLYTPIGSVPPFQIIIPHGSAEVGGVNLHRANGSWVANIKTKMEDAGLHTRRFASDGYDVVVFPSVMPMNITTEEGQYYLRLTMDNGTDWYSDVFTVSGFMGGYLMLQWWDLRDFELDDGRVVYTSAAGAVNYRNTLWLQTQLGKPDYTLEQEGEDRDGRFYAIKQVSEKVYRFQILANEALCDVMRLVRLSEIVILRDQWGNTYRSDTFLMTPKWEAQGNLASVEVEFTCDTVARKLGHGYTGWGTHGDYDGSYNNDYNNN